MLPYYLFSGWVTRFCCGSLFDCFLCCLAELLVGALLRCELAFNL